ncbi:MAG: ferredoxin [Candidatus Methylumidiphilus sp.]
MVVEPASPCRIRYRPRHVAVAPAAAATAADGPLTTEPAQTLRVHIDWDLCKGHGNCMSEAPEIFHVDEQGKLTLLDAAPPLELLAKAQAAQKYCPTQAIKITGEDCQGGGLASS